MYPKMGKKTYFVYKAQNPHIFMNKKQIKNPQISQPCQSANCNFSQYNREYEKPLLKVQPLFGSFTATHSIGLRVCLDKFFTAYKHSQYFVRKNMYLRITRSAKSAKKLVQITNLQKAKMVRPAKNKSQIFTFFCRNYLQTACPPLLFGCPTRHTWCLCAHTKPCTKHQYLFFPIVASPLLFVTRKSYTTVL